MARTYVHIPYVCARSYPLPARVSICMARIPGFVNVGSLMTPSAVPFNTYPNAGVIGMRHDIVSGKLLVLLVLDMPAPESTI